MAAHRHRAPAGAPPRSGRAPTARLRRPALHFARATAARADAPAPLPPRDAQAGERRRQLVRLASDLIEEAGIDAVSPARLTERAGCARTLVYRYFASREELLAAVLRDYFERLDARLPEAEQRAAVAAYVAASSAGDPSRIRDLIAVFWDVQVAAGLGGAILRATPSPSPQVEALLDECRERYERRITDPLRAAGLSAFESRIAVDLMIASFVGVARRWRTGAITAAQAIDVHARATVGLLAGLLAGRRRAGPAAEARRGRAPKRAPTGR